MTGGSLGLRTGSYGSLQSQFQNGAAFPIQSTLVFARKPVKMLPTGSREKEKIILPWVCKLCGKRKVGMLLILIASVAVFLSFISVINKENNDKEHISFFTRWDNESHPSVTVPYYRTLPVLHPCENFSIPHLQIDRKRTGPRPCPVCYVPVEQAIIYMPVLPSRSPILKNLTYVNKENSFFNESDSGSFFGGHPSLRQRNDYFDIKDSMTVHCGFVGGKKPGQGTGFDIDDDDLLEMDRCQGVVVASAIFGKYDVMQQPKNISEVSKTTVCFFMFLDEETVAYIKNSSSLDSTKKVGLWRIVVVRNLPYEDARRNGKVPKLLLHRLFPNARFSLWVDGKLELVVDPYQVLERFLWRKNASFAISRHYRRFDVFEEAEANKAAGKYDNASIDYQIEFYKKEGLTHYSELKLPITSDVPEGCVIIREHIPIANLFTCIWFNEVDRFTSRDQLSFSTVRDKIMQRVNWTVDMFLDCERRNFVIQAYHRDLLEQRNVFTALTRPPLSIPSKELPPRSNKQILPNGVVGSPMKKLPPTAKHRKSGSRRHRPRPPAMFVSSKDIN